MPPEALATTQVSLAAITLFPFFLIHGVTKYEFTFGPVMAILTLGILGTGYAYIWNFRILAAAIVLLGAAVSQGRIKFSRA